MRYSMATIGHCGAIQVATGGCHDSASIFLALPNGPRGDHHDDHRWDSVAAELSHSVDAAVRSGMPLAGWMRRWTGGRGAGVQASAPVLAAARGEPLGQLLSLGARSLLATSDADRAGLWLSGDRTGESGTGCVAEKVAGPIPEQWKRLDVTMPFLRAALESTSPLQVEFISGETATYLGPLIGMHSAVWIPLL